MRTVHAQTCVPIMPYFGGKTLMATWVNQYLPRSASAYIEGFAGSLAVGMARRPAPFEVVNDFDPGVANLYRVLKERPVALQNALRFTLHSRAEHARCRQAEKDRAAGRLSEDALEWARRHVVLVRQSYSAMFGGSWGYVREGGSSFHRVVDLIPPAAARLRNAAVENLHFRDLITKHENLGPDALWYLDPPYVPETRVAETVYRCEMSLEEHRQLMELITRIEGMVVLSGYRSALYDAALSDWVRIEKVVPCYASGVKSKTKPMRTECLWLNPAAVARLREEGRFADSVTLAA
jgi:DNA adenine methylase